MEDVTLGALWLALAFVEVAAIRTFQADPEPTPLYAAFATLLAVVVALGSLAGLAAVLVSTTATGSTLLGVTTTTTTYTSDFFQMPNTASSVGGMGAAVFSAFLMVISIFKATANQVQRKSADRMVRTS